MKFLFFFLGILFTSFNTYSQNIFQKVYGSSGNEFSWYIEPTKDNGYILTGYTNSSGAGGNDILLQKYDSFGKIQWSKTYGALGDDMGRSVKETTDGYVIAGEISTSIGLDYFLIKTDFSGNIIWSKSYNANTRNRPSNLIVTSDRSYIICGFSESAPSIDTKPFIVKTDASGNLQWSKSFTGNQTDAIYDLVEAFDGGYIGVGYSFSFGPGSGAAFINHIDNNGNVIWSKSLGYSDLNAGFYAIKKTPDNSYVMVRGARDFTSGGLDIWMLKMDISGNILWSYNYGGSAPDEGFSLQVTPSGEYVVAGNTQSFGQGNNDILLFKTDSEGNKKWAKVYGGPSDDRTYNMKLTSDGGLIIAGTTSSFGNGNSDIYLIKTDDQGNGGDCNYNSVDINRINFTPNVNTPTPSIITYNSPSNITPLVTSIAPTETIICNTCDIFINLGLDKYICEGSDTLTLDAQNPGKSYLWSDGSTGRTNQATKPGIYWVKVYDQICTKYDTVLVSGGIAPGTIKSNQTICLGKIPDPVISTSPAQSTSLMTIEYEWEINTGNGWTSAGTKSSSNLDYTFTAPLTGNTMIRRKAIAGTRDCEIAVTSPITITVIQPLIATITVPQVITSPDTAIYIFNNSPLKISAVPVPTGYSGLWTVSPNGNLESPATMVNNSIAGMKYEDKTTLRWTVRDVNNVCPPAEATIILQRKNITIADASDDSLCISNLPYQLKGNGLISNETSKWEFISASPAVTPIWSLTPDSRIAIISSVPIPANSGKVELLFKYTVSSPLSSTGPTFKTIKITVYELTETATTIGPINTCASFIQLTGNTPKMSTAQGVWAIINGQGVLETKYQSNTILSGLSLAGSTNLVWNIKNHLCPSTSSSLIVTKIGEITDARFNISGGPYYLTEITNQINIPLCTGVEYSLKAILPTTGLKPGEAINWSSSTIPSAPGNTINLSFTPTIEGSKDITLKISSATTGCPPSIAIASFLIGEKPTLDSIAGDINVCENSSKYFSVTLSNAPGTTTLPVTNYTWKNLPNTPTPTGFAILEGPGNNSSATFSFHSTSITGSSDQATISVVASNMCGTSSPITKTITINLTPQAFIGSIAGSDSICASSSGPVSYTIPNQQNTTDYIWTVENKYKSAIISTPYPYTTTGPISSKVLVDLGPKLTLKIALKNSCGIGVNATKPITIIPAVAVNVNISGPDKVCLPDDTLTYTGSTSNGGQGVNYSFKIIQSDGRIGKVQNLSPIKTFFIKPGELEFGDMILMTVVADSSTGCFVNNGIGQDSIYIDGYKHPETSVRNLNPSDSICSGNIITLCVPASKGNGGYQWYKDNIPLPYQTSSCIDLNQSSQTGAYKAMIYNEVCGNRISDLKNVKIYDNPNIHFESSKITVELKNTKAIALNTIIGGLITDTLTYTQWNSSTLLTFPTDSLSATLILPALGGIYTYKIEVATGLGSVTCPAFAEVEITALPTITIPNAFTPTGDGNNDIWEIKGIEVYKNAKVTIFNRWGDIVWEGSPYTAGNEWKGTNKNGELLPVATYYYIIDLNEEISGQKHFAGDVTIIR